VIIWSSCLRPRNAEYHDSKLAEVPRPTVRKYQSAYSLISRISMVNAVIPDSRRVVVAK
jgi:hypothetical protein